MDANEWQQAMLFFLSENMITLLFVSLFSYFVLKPYFDPRRKNLPPGPTGIPIFGYAPFLPSNYGPKLKQLFAKYGRIMSMRLGSHDVVFISDFEVMKKITKLPEYSHRPNFGVFTIFPVPTLVSCELFDACGCD